MGLFQKWFGPKSKIDQFKGISSDLSNAIKELKKIVADYEEKVRLITAVLELGFKEGHKSLTKQIQALKNYTILDKEAEKNEEIYILKVVETIKTIIQDEELQEELDLEKNILKKLDELRIDLQRLNENISLQITFFEKHPDLELSEAEIKELANSIKQEGIILFGRSLIKGKSFEETQLQDLGDLVFKKIKEIDKTFLIKNVVGKESLLKKNARLFLIKYPEPKKAMRMFIRYCNKNVARSSNLLGFHRDLKGSYYVVFIKVLIERGKQQKNKIYLESAIDLIVLVLKKYPSTFLNQQLIEVSDLLIKLDPQNIKNYTRKFDLLFKLQFFELQLYINVIKLREKALKDIEYARQVFPDKNVELLKLKAKLIKSGAGAERVSVFGKKPISHKFKGKWQSLSNIFTADDAYEEAREILGNLDKKENREKLAIALRKVGYPRVVARDFSGAKLTKLDRKTLQDTYGIRVYPITIIVKKVLWRGPSGLWIGLGSKFDLEDWVGGVNISSSSLPTPFNKLGGLRFLSRDFYDPHEDFHGSFHIYNLSTHPIVNELLAYSSNVVEGLRPWKSVKNTLLKYYIKHYYPEIKPKEEAKLREEIVEACDTVDLMQKVWGLKKTARTLLRCENLKEVIKFKNGLEIRFNEKLAVAESIFFNPGLSKVKNRKIIYNLLKDRVTFNPDYLKDAEIQYKGKKKSDLIIHLQIETESFGFTLTKRELLKTKYFGVYNSIVFFFS